MGIRLLEVLVYRERGSRREVQLLKALLFLQTTLWRYLFGRDAQDLEQSNTVGTPILECAALMFYWRLVLPEACSSCHVLAG